MDIHSYVRQWILLLLGLCIMQPRSSMQAFVCEDIQDPSVETKEIKFPPITIPAGNIGRQCSSQAFKTSSSSSNQSNKGQQYLIAYTPINASANTSEAVKRILLYYGCKAEVVPGGVTANDCEDILEQPSCHLIGAWSPGYPGDCFHHNTGVKIRTEEHSDYVLEVEWMNTSPNPVVVKNVGFTLYYTSQSGLHDTSMLKLGNDYVMVPPQSPAADVTSVCTGTCTGSMFDGEVFITAAFSRMNFLGSHQEVTILRGGKFLQHIFVTNLTSKTSGRQFNFHEPILLKPGDVIKTKCQYSSLNKTRTTFSTSKDISKSEQCFAYLRFHFPSTGHNTPSSLSCVSWRSLLPCDPVTEGGCTETQREKFRSENLPMTRSYNDVIAKCPLFGVCTEECKTAVTSAVAREPCMSNGDSWMRVKVTILAQSLFGRHLLSALASCELDLYKDAVAAKASKVTERKEEVGGAGLTKHEVHREVQKPSQTVSRRKMPCSNRSVGLQGPGLLVHSFLALLVVLFGPEGCVF